jgi:hypothetical protein
MDAIQAFRSLDGKIHEREDLCREADQLYRRKVALDGISVLMDSKKIDFLIEKGAAL